MKNRFVQRNIRVTGRIKNFYPILGLFLYFSLFFCGCSSSHNDKASSEVADVDFDLSLGTIQLGKKHFCHKDEDRKRYEICQYLWSKSRPSQVIDSQEPKIPKIIHQVWLSKHPLPERLKKYSHSWAKQHPDWQYRLWQEQDLQTLPDHIRHRIEKMEELQQKEELLACAILNQFGGVFVDQNFECLKPFDALHAKYDFYAGLEPPLAKRKQGRTLHVSPLIIGACPNHPITRLWLKKLQVQKQENETLKKKEHYFGYLSFGLAVDKLAISDDFNNIIFPPTYFFPVSSRWVHKYDKSREKLAKKEKAENEFLKAVIRNSWRWKEEPLFSSIQRESLAFHHTGGFWTFSGVSSASKASSVSKSSEKTTRRKKQLEKFISLESVTAN